MGVDEVAVMTAPDFGHTRKAEENRAVKAAALAAAARALGVSAEGLGLGAGQRRAVRLAAGYGSVSEESWFAAVQLLQVAPAGGPRPRGCRYHPTRDARPYLAGWLCDECSPWAQAQRAEPVPPPGTTLAELRAAHGLVRDAPPASTVVDDRAVASGKRRSTTATYQAVRAAQEHNAATARRRRTPTRRGEVTRDG